MRRINKVLIFFLVFIMMLFFAFWQVLQSESFANRVSQRITNAIQKRLDAKVEFERVEFKLIPPGVDLEVIKVEGLKIPNEEIDCARHGGRPGFCVLCAGWGGRESLLQHAQATVPWPVAARRPSSQYIHPSPQGCESSLCLRFRHARRNRSRRIRVLSAPSR